MADDTRHAWEDFQVAAQDALGAGYRQAHDTLCRLAAALDAEPLALLLRQVLPAADFDAWLKSTLSTGGSMVGSGRLSWPTEKEARVALQLQLVRELAAGTRVKIQGLLLHFYGSRLEQAYGEFSSNVLRPFVRDLARILEDDRSRRAMQSDTSNSPTNLPSVDPRTVFVVHGRNGAARDALFQFLRAIGLHPLEWTEAVALTKGASPYVGTVLEKAFAAAQAVVVLMTGDDEARLRTELREEFDEPHELQLTPQARPNVLFEAGLAFGVHPDRTILVELGRLRPFSDIGGRHTVRIGNRTDRRQDLAMRLRNAGCAVNLDGTDWHRAGDFDGAVT
jgi:predicted nucleotide-binding protein